NELDVWGGLFEGLEHGVERMPGKHVHLVDHVDLEATGTGRINSLFKQLRHFVDTTIRCRIELDIVHKTSGIDFNAGPAGIARLCRDAVFATQRFGENTRKRGLTYPASTRKQPCMMQALGVQSVGQRADHVVLANQSVE